MSNSAYSNAAQQRVLRTLNVLFGHEAFGLPPGEVARLVGTNNSNTTRDLANLKEAGFAEELPDTGHWRISPRLGQKAIAILNGIDALARKADEMKQRYTRLPNSSAATSNF